MSVVKAIVLVIAVLFMLVGSGLSIACFRQYCDQKQDSKAALSGGGIVILFLAGGIAMGPGFSLLITMGVALVALSAVRPERAPRWRQSVRALLSVFIVALAVVSIGWQLASCKKAGVTADAVQRTAANQIAVMKHKGRVLAENFRGRTALIIDDPRVHFENFDDQMAAFRKGIRGKLTLIEPRRGGFTLSEGDGHVWSVSPPQYSPEEFDTMLASRDDYDLVISFIGLPRDFRRMKFWDHPAGESRPEVVLLTEKNGNLKQMIRQKLVHGAFVTKSMTSEEYKTAGQLSPKAYAKYTCLYMDESNLDTLR